MVAASYGLRLVRLRKPAAKPDVVLRDKYGEEIGIGSLVEVAEHHRDRFYGVFYVVAFEVKSGGPLLCLLARSRWDKPLLAAKPSRLTLRCYEPIRQKEEGK